ncbi:MAG: ribbon-helix-helix domain-containing protein [Acidimicrobiales bacterium]
MKLSISLPDDDVAFLDRYATSHDVGSRSAVVQRALRLLRAANLEVAYAAAWEEWDGSEDAAAWDATSGDGAT